VRPVDLVVTELAVIAFPGGRATLMETAPGVCRRSSSSTPWRPSSWCPQQVPQMALQSGAAGHGPEGRGQRVSPADSVTADPNA
jgi:hypothetical protein